METRRFPHFWETDELHSQIPDDRLTHPVKSDSSLSRNLFERVFSREVLFESPESQEYLPYVRHARLRTLREEIRRGLPGNEEQSSKRRRLSINSIGTIVSKRFVSIHGMFANLSGLSFNASSTRDGTGTTRFDGAFYSTITITMVLRCRSKIVYSENKKNYGTERRKRERTKKKTEIKG